MPSVGMRRTTRVFGVVKGVDGARVLRSGRRLWPEFGDGKFRRTNDGDDWYHHQPVIKKHNNSNGPGHGPGGLKCKPNGWAHVQNIKLKQQKQEEEEEQVLEICESESESENEVKLSMKQESEVLQKQDRMFGLVYSRKRKRNGEQKKSEDKMYGIRFSRRQRRKSEDSSDNGASLRAFGVVFGGSCGGTSSDFLSLVLGYMKKARVELPDLASFLLSQSICGAFSLHGIRFLWVCCG